MQETDVIENGTVSAAGNEAPNTHRVRHCIESEHSASRSIMTIVPLIEALWDGSEAGG